MSVRKIRAPALGTLTFIMLAAAQAARAAESCPALLNHTFPRLQDESPMPLCELRGKVVLVVNTASFCGYTRQYDGLEKLHERLNDRGLVVLGFPSNDFGQQEPRTNQEVAEFCRSTYGVRFPMVAKSSVTGPAANPFFRQLIRATGDLPRWNFHKYLIDRSGSLVLSFPSEVEPDSPLLLTAIERLLAVAP